LFERVQAGDEIRIKGAQGGYYFDPENQPEPLLLISAGSGITPMMSISRFLKASGNSRPVKFLYGARSEADIIFRGECEQFANEQAWFDYRVCLSQPGESWTGECGRIDPEKLAEWYPELSTYRFFLCGPSDFMQVLQSALVAAGVSENRIHTEQFHSSSAPAVR
ncbi:MAG: hypothetical protein KDA84_12830, partial [Planctomycetaceae bacterium]|nr:hypothetical protein [Planctomycetaceae bacterium]